VVVDYTASWCGPCKAIAPFYGQLADRFRHVTFLKVDIDQLQETARAKGITSVPTFQFYKGGQKVQEIKGASPGPLEAMVNQLQGPADESTTVPALAGHSDITSFITVNQIECLNQSDAHGVKNIFTKNNQFLESDVDEQLIIVIPFNQVVKLHSIKLSAPLDKAPKTIRTFINRATTLSFDEADSIEPVEVLELTEKSYDEGTIIPLRFVKYQNVHCLTLFIADNLKGEETTVVNQLILYGSPVEATKPLSELKKDEH
ncbi:hypothetical protein HDV05_000752, partial [Chytridiales sp. JEL 0842]